MVNSTVEQRVEFLENAVREIGQMCLRVGNGDTANSNPARAILPAGTPEVAGTSSNAAASGQIVALSQFLAGVQPLSPGERLQVVEAAIKMLEGVFVHLPLKRAMHGIDPLQRLRLVKLRLEEAIVHNEAESSDRSFHDEMIEIFHSLRDLHTNYILPVGYQKRIAFLPFLIQEYFDGTPAARNYIVTRIQPGFVHDTFKEQVTITHWNGIPIDRAVEVNAAREAGSNSDARHARGLEALTIRPISLTAPPDEDWVIVGYQANGMNLEIRLQWQVMMPPVSLNSANVDDPMALAGPAAHVMGFDAATEATRRARKALFDPNAMGQERQMSQIVVAASGQPTSAFDAGAGTAAPFAFGDSSTTPYLYSYDAKGEELRKGKLSLLFPHHGSAQEGINAAAAIATTASMTPVAPGSAAGPEPNTTSLFPDLLSFRSVDTSIGAVGYVRIYSFMVYDANAFVAEFARIAALLPQDRLIIDVRKNGGGNINAGEQLLQVLAKKNIDFERFHFINTEATQTICAADPQLKLWSESIKVTMPTGEIYSQGFPLTSLQAAASVTYQYPGRVVLVIDALCYSTTDIFAAGFQDNQLGKILGTSRRTGAGGANVWPYELLLDQGFAAMPHGVSFRTAIRRATRVGDMAGVPLEDLGVQPDDVHRTTRRDLLENNADLIEAAAALF